MENDTYPGLVLVGLGCKSGRGGFAEPFAGGALPGGGLVGVFALMEDGVADSVP